VRELVVAWPTGTDPIERAMLALPVLQLNSAKRPVNLAAQAVVAACTGRWCVAFCRRRKSFTLMWRFRGTEPTSQREPVAPACRSGGRIVGL